MCMPCLPASNVRVAALDTLPWFQCRLPLRWLSPVIWRLLSFRTKPISNRQPTPELYAAALVSDSCSVPPVWLVQIAHGSSLCMVGQLIRIILMHSRSEEHTSELQSL